MATTPPDPDRALWYTTKYIADKETPDVDFHGVSVKEVSHVLRSLKNTNSCGLDNITTEVLKKYQDTILPFLTDIINRAIMTSEYPQDWKVGKIIPLPKKPTDLHDVSNWRPVTLLI